MARKTHRAATIVMRIVLFNLVLLLGAAGFVYWFLHKPLILPKDGYILNVKPGSSLNKVNRELHHIAVLSLPRLLTIYAQLTGQTSVKVGEYKLTEGQTPLGLLAQLNAGNVIQYPITFVEGSTYRQVVRELHQQEKLGKTLEEGEAGNEELRKKLMIEEANLEGLFFPDTYFYTKGMTDLDILTQAYERMKKVLQEEWALRAENLPYKNAYEALIMASIVEKETGAPEERSMIAGVFVRRLQKGMRLQTDPTVIYGMGDAYQGNIRRKHLQADTAYNTYTRAGLPPTPIALPGLKAIHAALHPQDGDSLYFVGMGDGHHFFSATLEEHDKAVHDYQLQRKKDYHSAPQSIQTR